MSVKIHHGPPGSYKTSGAVMDDFLPCVKQGRVVITNVRGLTLDRVREAVYKPSFLGRLLKSGSEPALVFPDIPEGFDIVFLDTTRKAERDKLSRWFHWAPKGAFFLIDEAQSVFPPRWTAKDIAALDYPARAVSRQEVAEKYAHIDVPLEEDFPGRRDARIYAAYLLESMDSTDRDFMQLFGVDAAKLDWCPANWNDAWEMHRHYGWDLTLTTPNIRSLRSDIREVSEGAYKHRNLAVVGFGGRYMEGFHDAQDNGSSQSNFISLTSKKISKEVWGLYDSTSTGTIADTLAGIKLWKDPKILFLLAIVAGALYMSFRNPLPAVLGGKKAADNKPPAPSPLPQTSAVPVPGSPRPPVPDLSGRVDGFPAGRPVDPKIALPVTQNPESEWRAAGHYQINGTRYVLLKREGVTRIIKNPKDAKYDDSRVSINLDGRLVDSFTGSRNAPAGVGKL